MNRCFAFASVTIFVAAAVLGPFVSSAHAQACALVEKTYQDDSLLPAASDALVASLNGSSASRSQFVSEYLGAVPLSERPARDWIALLERAAHQSGGVDVIEVRPRAGRLDVLLRTREDSRVGRALLYGPDEAGCLEGLYFVPMPEWTPPNTWPTSGPRSDAELAMEVERQVAAAAARDAFSGVVLIASSDSVLYRRAFGQAEKAFDVPNRPDTRFHLASLSKLFTVIAVLQLVEDGRLQLSDPIATLLPGYPNLETAQQITVAHLLTHSAGLGNLFERPSFDAQRDYERHADLLRTFAHEELAFAPGAQSSYSNEGFIVLGAIVEQLSGLTFAEYVEQRVFEPAGMIATGFYALDEVVPNRAVGYRLRGDDPFGVAPRRAFWFTGGGVRGNAAGGAYATADDLLRFVRALRGGALLSEASLDLLAAPYEVGAVRRGLGIQLGDVDGMPIAGHGGGGPSSGVDAELRWTADGAYTVIVLANYEMVATPLAFGTLTYLAKGTAAHSERGS